MTEDLRLSFFRLVGAIEMHKSIRRGRDLELTDLDQRLYNLARDEAAKHQAVGENDECDSSGQIPTGECRVAMSGPTCTNGDCPPCQTPETDPCPGCRRCEDETKEER